MRARPLPRFSQGRCFPCGDSFTVGCFGLICFLMALAIAQDGLRHGVAGVYSDRVLLGSRPGTYLRASTTAASAARISRSSPPR